MRVDAVPQPASFCLPPPHLLQTVRTRAGKGDTRRGTEPWQEVGGGRVHLISEEDPNGL